MSNEASVPVRRLSQDEVCQAGPELAKSGFVTGDAHDATVAVLLEQIAVLRQNPTRSGAEGG